MYRMEVEQLNRGIERRNAQHKDGEKQPLRKVESFEDFSKSGRSLEGFVYPLDSEITELFDAPLRRLFDAIEEIDEDGKIALNEPVAEYSSKTFAERQRRAVQERGSVIPGLAGKQVQVVEVPRHPFAGTGNQAISKARQWSKQNLYGQHTAHKGLPSEFKYTIDEDAIGKYLSKSSTKGSDNWEYTWPC